VPVSQKFLFQFSCVLFCFPSGQPQRPLLASHSFRLVSALTAVGALMTLIDFTLSNARRFYSSMGNPLAVKGLEDSEPSEPLISSESEESQLASLQISLTSESISIPQNSKISRNSTTSFDQPSESEFVTIHGVPVFHRERADDSVTQICDAIRNIAVQESPRSKLVVSFPVFRGGESEDVFHRQF